MIKKKSFIVNPDKEKYLKTSQKDDSKPLKIINDNKKLDKVVEKPEKNSEYL